MVYYKGYLMSLQNTRGRRSIDQHLPQASEHVNAQHTALLSILPPCGPTFKKQALQTKAKLFVLYVSLMDSDN